MRKIFIEIDKYETDHIETMEDLMGVEFKFDEIIEDAYFKGADLLTSIEAADEIYVETALIDRSGTLFENLMYHAVEKKWTGKKLFIFRPFKSIWFSCLHHTKNTRTVFSKLGNELFVVSDGGYEWEKVDVLKQIKLT